MKFNNTNIYTNMGRSCSVQVWKLLLIFGASFCSDVLSKSNQVHTGGIIPGCIWGANSVSYYLYNRNNHDGVIVDLNSSTIPVDKNLTTVFLVHGFVSEANTSKYIELTHAYVDEYDVNVFAVDWAEGACSTGGIELTELLGFPQAVRNTRAVGEDMSKFIRRLISDYGMQLEDINLVGHSLGAQVVGFAGKDLQKQGTGTIHHIMALDPAGPTFENQPCDGRICETDADFVQVFHTSIAFGIHKAIGNIDFYFNGGGNQPGCPVLTRPICSHTKAIVYLIDIIENRDCEYIGKMWNRTDSAPPEIRCSDETCSIPGPSAADLPARGTFYVDTKDVPSFCQDLS